jgi:hypothetical protein
LNKTQGQEAPVYALQKRFDMNEKIAAVLPEENLEDARPAKKRKQISKPLQSLLDGEFLTREGVVNNLPYLAFLAIIAIIYIANTYYAEKTFKQIEATKIELKELRYQYITTRANLMYLSKQTEIAKRVKEIGLKETTIPPYKIFYSGLAHSTKGEE